MKKALAVLTLSLASIALVACGNSSTTTSSTASTPTGGAAATGAAKTGSTASGGQTLKLDADPGGQLKYTTDHLSAKPGNVTIDFKNPQPISHDVAVQSASGQSLGTSKLISQGSTTLSLKNLKPGTYTYFCTVPGHEQAGMKGTLTVK